MGESHAYERQTALCRRRRQRERGPGRSDGRPTAGHARQARCSSDAGGAERERPHGFCGHATCLWVVLRDVALLGTTAEPRGLAGVESQVCLGVGGPPRSSPPFCPIAVASTDTRGPAQPRGACRQRASTHRSTMSSAGKAKKSGKKPAPAPYSKDAAKAAPAKEPTGPIWEKKPKNFAIGGDIQPRRELGRYV